MRECCRLKLHRFSSQLRFLRIYRLSNSGWEVAKEPWLLSGSKFGTGARCLYFDPLDLKKMLREDAAWANGMHLSRRWESIRKSRNMTGSRIVGNISRLRKYNCSNALIEFYDSLDRQTALTRKHQHTLHGSTGAPRSIITVRPMYHRSVPRISASRLSTQPLKHFYGAGRQI